MLLFHTTFFAARIFAEGFRDGETYNLANTPYPGIWFSTVPMKVNARMGGDVCLAIEIPEEEVIPYEFVEDGQTFREFLVPAALANRYGRPTVHDSFYSGSSRSGLRRLAGDQERSGTWSGLTKAAHIREMITFLERHDLLAAPRSKSAHATHFQPLTAALNSVLQSSRPEA